MGVLSFGLVLLSTAAVVTAEGEEGGAPPFNIHVALAGVYLAVIAGAVAITLAWQAAARMSAYLRKISCLNNPTQRYFVSASTFLGPLKEHLIYAPLFGTRHNRELQLTKSLTLGTVPSRLQTLILFGVVGFNFLFLLVDLDFSSKELWDDFRSRAGAMAVANLIPLVIFAGRNNPLIAILHVSFDTFNFLHRWIARCIVLEAIAHALVTIVPVGQKGGTLAIGQLFQTDAFCLVGLVAVCGFMGLNVHSFSPLRHAFYETFLHTHIALVLVTFGFLWTHLNEYTEQRYLLLPAIIAWAAERTVRLITLFRRNIGNGGTTVAVEALAGNAMRVTLFMARPWTFKPGQHVYLYLPSVGFWTSHPFSVAWSETRSMSLDKESMLTSFDEPSKTMSLVIKRQGGFTDKLYKRAAESVGRPIYLTGFVEGPYGGIHEAGSYGTVLLFAGGVGITHPFSFVRELVSGYANGTAAARKVTLAWAIQSPDQVSWVYPWLMDLLEMERCEEVLRVKLFITRPGNTEDMHRLVSETSHPSSRIVLQTLIGRPDPEKLIDEEIEQQVGAMGVMVCGSGSLSDGIRRACRKRQTQTHIDFIEESFSW
ncbi:hypothetical protein DTO166G4_5512 [Paecilomyces variotii]|nr:hypothetical protein DTO166G4_5512 [Paecilomyces variotii]KAJ9241572.1 hypothetical protein DTO166G5_1193 [Paecilomyces variotii]KAJ9394837.1 hypothetical protein DTO282F9_8223 [Paecilomyces variotii]